VQATDPAGNTDPTPASRSFTVDADPPDTSIASGPDGVTSDQTPTFGLVSDEPGSTFECRIDGGSFSSCSTPHTTASLSGGSHTFEARAIDGVGNADATPASRTFTVDTTGPPETTITRAPKAKIKSKRKRVKVSLEFSADEPGRFECSLDGEDFSACTSPSNRKVGKGRHSWSVRAIDEAGEADPSAATATFKVKVKRKKR